MPHNTFPVDETGKLISVMGLLELQTEGQPRYFIPADHDIADHISEKPPDTNGTPIVYIGDIIGDYHDSAPLSDLTPVHLRTIRESDYVLIDGVEGGPLPESPTDSPPQSYVDFSNATVVWETDPIGGLSDNVKEQMYLSVFDELYDNWLDKTITEIVKEVSMNEDIAYESDSEYVVNQAFMLAQQAIEEIRKDKVTEIATQVDES